MKQLVKLTLGAAVFLGWRVFSPSRITAIRDRLFASHDLSFLERQAVAFMLAVTPQSTREATNYWASSAGSRFHSDRDHRLTLDLVRQDDFYRRPMLDAFAAQARQSLSSPANVVEVGCGAGGNLLYLRHVLSGLGFRYTGFDINGDVIASNQPNAADDLSFVVKNCFASDLVVPGDLGLVSCAVLMYVQETDIRAFLERLARSNSGRILIGLSEPVSDPDAPHSAEHNNLALTHGYRRIFTQLGFTPRFESVLTEQNKNSRIYHAVFELAR